MTWNGSAKPSARSRAQAKTWRRTFSRISPDANGFGGVWRWRSESNHAVFKEHNNEQTRPTDRAKLEAITRCRGTSAHDGQAATGPSGSTASPIESKQVIVESPQVFVPSAEAQKLYADFLAETNKRELSGSENFDKSVLTLSSAGLALSVSFLKDFSPIAGASLPWMLYTSWALFTVATLSTMASFLVSGQAMSHQKTVAHRAYVLGEEAAFEESNPWGIWVPGLNLASAASFFFALIFTVAFIVTNLEGNRMTTGNFKVPAAGSLEQRGAPVPTMQRPVSAPVAAPTPPASAPSGGQGNGASSQ